MDVRAAVAFNAGKPLEVTNVKLDGPRAGEVLVEIKATGICHTDEFTLSGADPEGLFPAILGHEGAGIVVDVGPGVTSVKKGDHVIPLYTPECRSCPSCLSRKTNLCTAIRATQGQGVMPDGTSRFSIDGKKVHHYMGCSTFSNFTVLPEIAVAKIREDAPFDKVCYIGCGVTTGISAVINTAKVEPGSKSTTFLRDPDNAYRAGYVYGRSDNFSVQQAENLIAALEGADEALLFSSGMAAATSVLLALDKPTHIIASQIMYWGFRSWLKEIGRFGHSISFVETSDLDAVRAAIRPGETGLFWIETPSNPLWTITDIAAIADIAHAVDAILCVDSTVATPILTRPLSLGADIVMHSATKYLNGHSDIVAGALATARVSRLWEQIRKTRSQLGSALSAFDAWLLMRGMRTLDVRVRRQSSTAATLADQLVGHPAVSAVLYPGLAQHVGHEVALRQMIGGFGGMFSIRIRKGERAAIAVAAAVGIWKRATSFGGIESLIEHRASIEGAGSPCPGDLLRFSAGLEDVDELHFDLLRALAATRD